MNRQFIIFPIIIVILLIAGGCVTKQEKGTWIKYENNPVSGGGDLGTIFDIPVLKEDGVYKMYCSWRPKKSLALSISSDGVNWSRSEIILGPDHDNNWEEDINKPVVLKKGSIYHLWYTDQSQGKYF